MNVFSISTANARSVEQKIPSLVDHFENTDSLITIISETWLKKNNVEEIKEKLKNENDIGLISFTRPGNKLSLIHI